MQQNSISKLNCDGNLYMKTGILESDRDIVLKDRMCILNHFLTSYYYLHAEGYENSCQLKNVERINNPDAIATWNESNCSLRFLSKIKSLLTQAAISSTACLNRNNKELRNFLFYRFWKLCNFVLISRIWLIWVVCSEYTKFKVALGYISYRFK